LTGHSYKNVGHAKQAATVFGVNTTYCFFADVPAGAELFVAIDPLPPFDRVRTAWLAQQQAIRELNEAIATVWPIGLEVEAMGRDGKWHAAKVHWTAHLNGPAANQHIYTERPNRQPQKHEMGGGVFHTVRHVVKSCE